MHLKSDLIAALTFSYTDSIGANLVAFGNDARFDVFALPIVHADIRVIRINPDHRLA